MLTVGLDFGKHSKIQLHPPLTQPRCPATSGCTASDTNHALWQALTCSRRQPRPDRPQLPEIRSSEKGGLPLKHEKCQLKHKNAQNKCISVKTIRSHGASVSCALSFSHPSQGASVIWALSFSHPHHKTGF